LKTQDRPGHSSLRTIQVVEQEILNVIAKSEVPEDLAHAKNTRDWLLELKPDADWALYIAALGHDIERSIKKRKVKRKDFKRFDLFKRAHSENSARIMEELLTRHRFDRHFIDRVVDLILRHEVGGTPDADTLKDADSISFFDVNLPHYYRRNSVEETRFRIQWGFARLSPRARAIVRTFRYDDPRLTELFETAVRTAEEQGSSPTDR
jgi:hypothetical protein